MPRPGILHGSFRSSVLSPVIAQLGEPYTEDLKVPGSIPGRGIAFFFSKLGLQVSLFRHLCDRECSKFEHAFNSLNVIDWS
jgi:hypothetical protein